MTSKLTDKQFKSVSLAKAASTSRLAILGGCPDRIPLASAPQLLDQVLGNHATATKHCSFTHQFQESALSFCADDAYVLHVNHQFQDNLKNLIQTKLEGGKIAEVEKPKKPAPAVDLMSALKQSLAEMEGKKKPAATAPQEAAASGKRSRGRG